MSDRSRDSLDFGRRRSGRRFLLAAAVAFAGIPGLVSGCGDENPGQHRDGHAHGQGHHDSDAHDHGHRHEARHGGTLVEIGDHFAHLEAVLDAEEGRVTLYVLDGDADGGQRVSHERLEIAFREIDGEAADFVLEVGGVESVLTGETVGDTSQFETVDERLVGVERFVAELAEIEIRGQRLDAVEIRYPEGNQ